MKKTILRYISFIISALLCFSTVSVAANDEPQVLTDSIMTAFENSGDNEITKDDEKTSIYGAYGTYAYTLFNYCGAKNRDGMHAITSYNTNENKLSYALDRIEGKVLDKLYGVSISLKMAGSDTLTEIGAVEMRYLVKSENDYFAIKLDYVNAKAYAVVKNNGIETITEISNFAETGMVPITISVDGKTVNYRLELQNAGTQTGSFEVANMNDLQKNCQYIWQIGSKAASGSLRFCYLSGESITCTLKTPGDDSDESEEDTGESIISIPLTGEVGQYDENLGEVMPVENTKSEGKYGTFTPYIKGMVSAKSNSGGLRLYAYTSTENYVEYEMNIPNRRFVGLKGADITMMWQSPGERTVHETRFLVSESGDDYIAFGLNVAQKNFYFNVVDDGVQNTTEIDIEPLFSKKYNISFNIDGTALNYTLSTEKQGNVSGSIEVPNIDKLNKNCANHIVYYAKEIVNKGEGFVFFENPRLRCLTLPIGDVSTDSLEKGYMDEENECEVLYGLIDKSTNQPVTSLIPNSTLTFYSVGENSGDTDKTALVMLALYKNGVPQKLIPYSITFAAGEWTNYKSSAEISLPDDVTGYSIKCFMWPGFDDIRTNFDFIEIK